MADEQIGRLLILLEAQTAKLDEQIKQSTKGLSDFKDMAGLARNALEAFGVGEIFKSVIEATAEGEKAQALLESQIKATGASAGITAQQLVDMAHGFQDTTTTSATQVEQLEGQLLAFKNIAKEQFKGAIQAALDFSAVTGHDATAAVQALGMALNDPIAGMTRLTKAGISLDDATKETIKTLDQQGDLIGAQNLLLERMQQSYGGAAAAARDTLGGALKGLKNDFADLLEGHGAGVTGMTDAVKDLDATIKDPATAQGIQTLVTGMLELAGAAAKAAAFIASIPKSIGESLAHAQGYVGSFDDQITRLNGLVKQTQDQIDGLEKGGTPADSPAVTQLQRQLAQYKYQLQDVQLYQKAITGSDSAQPAGNGIPALNTLLSTEDLNRPIHVDELQQFSPDINGKLLNSHQQLIADQKQVVEIWKENDPAVELQRQIDKTNELVNTQVNGILFTAEDAQKHIASLQLAYDKQNDAMVASAQSAAQGIQSDFEQFLMNPFQEGLAGLAKAFEQTLLQMLAQAESMQLMKALFGGGNTSNDSGTIGLGMVLNNIFGGHRAGGGPVSAGMLYQVNEGGPNTEVFAPSTGGQVIPLGAGAGHGGAGSNVSITQHFDLRGASGDAAGNALTVLPVIRRMFQSDVEYRIARGTWPG